MRHTFGFSLVFGLVVLLAAPAAAQKTTGDITGTVTDSTGGVLPGATVTRRVYGHQLHAHARSPMRQGGFRLSGAADLRLPGHRRAPGLQDRQPRSAAGAPTPSPRRTSSSRSAPSPRRSPSKASRRVIEFSDKLNNRVDSKRIEAMPLSGRDFNSLLNVTPGRAAPARAAASRASTSAARAPRRTTS